MSKHTPGPWRVTAADQVGISSRRPRPGEPIGVRAHGSGRTKSRMPTSAADQGSAAPAMLALLKKIAAGDGQDEVIDDVLELIERAES